MSDSDRTGLALLAREEAPAWDLLAPRFPVVRRGYDRDSVDDYLAELERELEELRAGRSPSTAVAAEIARIGEQTAAILRVAHEQASETTIRAQEEADRCLSAAAANAVAITEEAQQRLRQLDAETDAIWRERARLLEDVRSLATSLSGLADDALERFPAENDRTAAIPAVPAEPAPAPTAEIPPPVAAQPINPETEAGPTDDEVD